MIASLFITGCKDNTFNIGIDSNFECDIAQANATFPNMGYPVEFRFTNMSDSSVRVLTWHTPFEGWWSKFLLVEQNGKKLDYLGPMAKRSAADEDDYITFLPNETKVALIDLAQAYQFDVEAPLTITYQNNLVHPEKLEAYCSVSLLPIRP
ncbi:protease [Pseudoalteromonas luteoviolacea]|uniref:protease n=1 Tax=Pseudoalteromonas luteoviolacea TaxID=43657 RepID=UPI000A747DA7|nr:protease [Pseudoalteromonas luteoviolacea]